jgi:hypothetical protein
MAPLVPSEPHQYFQPRYNTSKRPISLTFYSEDNLELEVQIRQLLQIISLPSLYHLNLVSKLLISPEKALVGLVVSRHL